MEIGEIHYSPFTIHYFVGKAMDGDARTETRNQPREIRGRSFAYALRAVKLYQYLQKQKDGAGWVLGKQYLRAACSIGANIEEAQASESRPDFIHKLGIAQKEARESLFWLRVLSEAQIVSKAKLRSLMQETDELVSVITSIVVNLKRKQRRAS